MAEIYLYLAHQEPTNLWVFEAPGTWEDLPAPRLHQNHPTLCGSATSLLAFSPWSSIFSPLLIWKMRLGPKSIAWYFDDHVPKFWLMITIFWYLNLFWLMIHVPYQKIKSTLLRSLPAPCPSAPERLWLHLEKRMLIAGILWIVNTLELMVV